MTVSFLIRASFSNGLCFHSQRIKELLEIDLDNKVLKMKNFSDDRMTEVND